MQIQVHNAGLDLHLSRENTAIQGIAKKAIQIALYVYIRKNKQLKKSPQLWIKKSAFLLPAYLKRMECNTDSEPPKKYILDNNIDYSNCQFNDSMGYHFNCLAFRGS